MVSVFHHQSGIFLMINRIIFDRSQLSVSAPGVDVYVAPQFSLSFDGNATAGKIWTKGMINTSSWNGQQERVVTLDTIWFGKTFPSPPLFCVYLDNIVSTGWGDRFQDGFTRVIDDDEEAWYSSLQLEAFNDRLEFKQYADWYEDLVYNSVLYYTIWDHPH